MILPGLEDAIDVRADLLQVGWSVWVSGEFRQVIEKEVKGDGKLHLLFRGGKGHVAEPEQLYDLAPTSAELQYPNGEKRTVQLDG